MSGVRRLREFPSKIDSIVIIGSTCVGKTTLVNAVRGLPGVDVPVRLVTRARRADDVTAEATCITSAELDAAIARGEVAMHWSRVLTQDRTERYAFLQPVAFPVFSANNAVCTGPALDHALIVGVFAPDPIRETRLRMRSPALWRDAPEEVRSRLAERADAVLSLAHVVIDNHGEYERTAAQSFVELVQSVIRARC